MCIVRYHSGDHIDQALYVKEDLRVLDDVITLIFRIETRKSVIHFFIRFCAGLNSFRNT